MSLAAFKVFSQFSQGSMTEVLQYNVDLFNSATRGALVLEAKSNEGDYSSLTKWAKIDGLVRMRNAYGSGAVASKTLAQLEEISVKVAAGTPPVEIDPHWFQWILKSPEEAGTVYGRQLAEDRLANMVDIAIAALAVSIGGQASNVHDGTAAIASLGALNTTRAKLGDKANRLAAWLTHSKVAFDIWGAALTNANQLFQFGTVNVIQDGFGNPIIMSDSPSLMVAGGVDDGDGSAADGDAGGVVPIDLYRTLGLTQMAALVQDNGDYLENVETSNGDESIKRTIQSQWTYNLGLKGFAWDKTAGGKSPTAAALATSANWDRTATSHKDLPGVLLNSR